MSAAAFEGKTSAGAWNRLNTVPWSVRRYTVVGWDIELKLESER